MALLHPLSNRFLLVLSLHLVLCSNNIVVEGRSDSPKPIQNPNRVSPMYRGGSSTAVKVEEIMATATAPKADMNAARTSDNDGKDSLLVVFSDLDGTLIHYPDTIHEAAVDGDQSSIIQLPPSSTGLVGIISAQTLVKCQDIRQRGVKLVLVSGMRSSTLLKRMPYLPRADAYCCEAGGRIYYPTTAAATDDDASHGFCKIEPVSYHGASEEDLEPFHVAEDMDWRSRMEQLDACGPDGFVGNDMTDQDAVLIEERKGLLWSFAQSLQKQGLVLDTKGYATCFRVNRKQQANDQSLALFDKLLNGDIAYPPELDSSVNLGCIDFYPNISGKKQCCKYIAGKFGGSESILSTRCVCICDDDNDLEMALACSHAFIPSISSASMSTTIQAHPTKFTKTFSKDVDGVLSSEAALALILERLGNE
ncbi:hypothetical protein MPSEU_000229800 [Mayamaea pseudoterrestris]|nr:hypothetical protein MPSEU_000229800 [Mayamaea pseudoterrestris]